MLTCLGYIISFVFKNVPCPCIWVVSYQCYIKYLDFVVATSVDCLLFASLSAWIARSIGTLLRWEEEKVWVTSWNWYPIFPVHFLGRCFYFYLFEIYIFYISYMFLHSSLMLNISNFDHFYCRKSLHLLVNSVSGFQQHLLFQITWYILLYWCT